MPTRPTATRIFPLWQIDRGPRSNSNSNSRKRIRRSGPPATIRNSAKARCILNATGSLRTTHPYRRASSAPVIRRGADAFSFSLSLTTVRERSAETAQLLSRHLARCRGPLRSGPLASRRSTGGVLIRRHRTRLTGSDQGEPFRRVRPCCHGPSPDLCALPLKAAPSSEADE